jgi:phospholipid/cholesterol/gamma-HCH transport system permease protein
VCGIPGRFEIVALGRPRGRFAVAPCESAGALSHWDCFDQCRPGHGLSTASRRADLASLSCEVADGALRLRLAGAWTLTRPWPQTRELEQMLATPGLRRIVLDAAGISHWDSSLVVFLGRTQERARAAGLELELGDVPEGASRLLAMAEAVPEQEGARRRAARLSPLARLGTAALAANRAFLGSLAFVGELMVGFGRLATLRARFRRSDFLLFVQECGAEALPIVTLISVLVGMILAFVGAVQLRQFGAAIYVADLVGIAMAREMGALMVGILMAGRTGAAYAAQLGTMKVTEEIDALMTLGLPPMEFLVLPRALALFLMMPLLCLYADALGMLGGAVVAVGMLDLGALQYFQEIARSLRAQDVVLGVVKSAVFGVLVAYAGCRCGMESGRSAAAVGGAATKAVVTAIVLLVVADGFFAVLCETLGI